MVEYDRKVQEKVVRANEKRLKNQKEINSQLDEFNINYIKKMKQEQLEGELIKKQVEEEIERQMLKDLDKTKKIAKTRQEFKDANDKLIKIQQQIAIKEKEEENKIIEYQKKRDALEHLKKTKVQERFATKQATQQKLVDR